MKSVYAISITGSFDQARISACSLEQKSGEGRDQTQTSKESTKLFPPFRVACVTSFPISYLGVHCAFTGFLRISYKLQK